MKVAFTEKEIKGILETLNTEDKDILFSKKVFLKLKEIIKNCNFSENKQKLLFKIIGLVVIKKISKQELYTVLELNLGLEEDEAINIVNQINTVLELGAIEARNKKLQVLRERKEEEKTKEEKVKEKSEEEKVVFEKPTRGIDKKDSYREIL